MSDIQSPKTRSMISIKVSKGTPYIWDQQDWLKLRTEHRIVGGLDGPVGNGLCGRVRWNLPMRLSQVEAQYLVAQGIAETLHAPKLYEENPVIETEIMDKLLQERKQKHFEEYKKKRKSEIENNLDNMLEGKRKKGRIGDAIDKDAFVKNELDKITKSPYDMYQLDLKDQWLKDEDYLPFEFPIPVTYLEKLRLRVFEDFHLHKKYWVTPGNKFGGDFLAYPGDPRHFHGEYIIMCLEKNVPLFSDLVLSQCRLATTVKKTLIIATLDEESDKLMYRIPKARK